ncbi:hypothetical protein EB796_017292 [Bugula neritina]|uniref:Secreted protein n=1 Tax=Bugula neritina TaxID=10212 RepID=A0A7J7JDT9_BUGNE|nr:hypothetical protein EB796_017292 [Bugula neritina]
MSPAVCRVVLVCLPQVKCSVVDTLPTHVYMILKERHFFSVDIKLNNFLFCEQNMQYVIVFPSDFMCFDVIFF